MIGIPLHEIKKINNNKIHYFRTRMGEHTLSAGTSDKRMYWLSQLQRARREYSQAGAAAAARSSMSCQVRKWENH